jgi:hypothetical protein
MGRNDSVVNYWSGLALILWPISKFHVNIRSLIY